MTTHGSAAASARRHKERHPELYCHDPRCLWSTSRSGPCPRHPEPLAPSPGPATTPTEPHSTAGESLKGETFSQLGDFFRCNPDPSCGARDVVHAIDCDMDEDCACDIFQGVATGFGRTVAGERGHRRNPHSKEEQ